MVRGPEEANSGLISDKLSESWFEFNIHKIMREKGRGFTATDELFSILFGQGECLFLFFLSCSSSLSRSSVFLSPPGDEDPDHSRLAAITLESTVEAGIEKKGSYRGSGKKVRKLWLVQKALHCTTLALKLCVDWRKLQSWDSARQM